MPLPCSTHRNVWILKPSEGGKGERIEVMDDGNAILDFLCALVRPPALLTRRTTPPRARALNVWARCSHPKDCRG